MERFELTGSQMYMYLISRAGLGQAALLCGSVLIPGQRDVADLQRAANEIFRINDGIRPRFVEEGGKVYQETLPYEEREFEVLHFNSREELDEYGEAYATVPFELVRVEDTTQKTKYGSSASPQLIFNILRGRLRSARTMKKYGLRKEHAACDVKLVILPDAYGAIAKIHHVISDAWTCLLLGNQFVSILNGETPKSYDFSEHALSEAAYYETKRYQRDKRFYEEQLAVCPEPTPLWPQPYTTLEARRTTVTLTEEQTRRIYDYHEKTGFTPFVQFLAAMSVFARRKTGKDAFYLGVVTIGREGVRERNSTGMYVNSLPLLMQPDESTSFADYLAIVRDKEFSGFRHQKPGSHDYGFGNMLYDTWLSYQTAVLEENEQAECRQYYAKSTAALKILSIEDRNGKGALSLHFDANLSVTDAEIDEMFRVTLGVLFDGLEDDTRPLSALGRPEEGRG